MCYAALGTDTAGSIRVPAACCGVVGLKPSYGLVPVRGVIPLAWSFDHVGPIARTVEDTALVLAAIAGYDAKDNYSYEYPGSDYAALLGDHPKHKAAHVSVSRLRVGVGGEFYFRNLHPQVAATMSEAISVLAHITAGVTEVDGSVEVDSGRVIHKAQAWAYHSESVAKAPELYQPETLRRLRQGEQVSAAEYILQCQRLRRLRNDASRLFREVDVILTPAVPIPPPTIAELQANPDGLRNTELHMLRNTRPFNIVGAPAIAVGNVQLAAAPGQENTLLALAMKLQEQMSCRH